MLSLSENIKSRSGAAIIGGSTSVRRANLSALRYDLAQHAWTVQPRRHFSRHLSTDISLTSLPFYTVFRALCFQ